MIILDKYKLPESNYNKKFSNKKRIVISNSFSVNMSHYVGWLNRYNGKYKKTAHYTITLDGKIYQHIDPIYQSEFIGDKNFDESTIYVVIENEGWLREKIDSENTYINYVGYIYNRDESVFVKSWRNNNLWAPYSKEQIESTIFLIKNLVNEFNINKSVPDSNVKIVNQLLEYGVLYRGNIDTKYTDVNPNWGFTFFKDNIFKK